MHNLHPIFTPLRRACLAIAAAEESTMHPARALIIETRWTERMLQIMATWWMRTLGLSMLASLRENARNACWILARAPNSCNAFMCLTIATGVSHLPYLGARINKFSALADGPGLCRRLDWIFWLWSSWCLACHCANGRLSPPNWSLFTSTMSPWRQIYSKSSLTAIHLVKLAS